MDVRAYAVLEEKAPLTPWNFTRRDLGAGDVAIEEAYVRCGSGSFGGKKCA